MKILRLFTPILVAVVLLSPASVLADKDDALVQRIISDQIEAFKADDFVTAFEFASPSIKQIFGSANRFGAMVKQGYPMVWRPSKVVFGALSDRGGSTVQTVLITDQGGVLHVLDYELITIGGDWQINGVSLRKSNSGA